MQEFEVWRLYKWWGLLHGNHIDDVVGGKIPP